LKQTYKFSKFIKPCKKDDFLDFSMDPHKLEIRIDLNFRASRISRGGKGGEMLKNFIFYFQPVRMQLFCLKKDGCTWYSRRAGVKPPPDRAKRSIFIFSLKNPLRQLFIQVAVMNDEGEITHGRINLFFAQILSTEVTEPQCTMSVDCGIIHVRINLFFTRTLSAEPEFMDEGGQSRHTHGRITYS
jgi:hypothetical protein